MKFHFNSLVRKLFVLTLLIASAHTSATDTKSHKYQQQMGVAGKITSVGSDTLANLMTLWSQEFKRIYPHVKFQIQASGSSTAPPALIEGTATIGPMSRELKISELRAFERKHGYPPLVLRVALDAIAIFVERQNPVEGLTFEQVDAIFSSTRYCGASQAIDFWQQLNITLANQQDRIYTFGRNSVSGTYGLFKVMALCEGDFRRSVNEQPGSASVVLSVASSKSAIGYAAYGYKTAGVRPISIGATEDTLVPLTIDTVRNQTYPYTRFLYLVVNKPPNQPLPLLEREFIKFILSERGQELVSIDGYFPITEELAIRQRTRISN